MTDKIPVSKRGFSADWLMRGALTRIGDSLDRLTGRKWIPSSSLATSELIERLRKLLDSEAKEIPDKGKVVPHNIKLKMQWDKFSTDADDGLSRLEQELLTAAADHINDSLYYTYAPLQIEVSPDYFTEGVKLFASFEKFADEEHEAELNVTIPAINVKTAIAEVSPHPVATGNTFVARFEIKGCKSEKRLNFPAGRSLSIGRTGGNDLVIDDASLSKIHASLIADAEGQLSVADTGSTNGTFVNEQRIAYGKATRLVAGDRIKFGMVDVVFEHIPPPPDADPNSMPDNESQADSTSIDGLEFKSRVAAETTTREQTSHQMPDDTFEIEQPNAMSEEGESSNADTLSNSDKENLTKADNTR